jgi:hypothetical protein
MGMGFLILWGVGVGVPEFIRGDYSFNIIILILK